MNASYELTVDDLVAFNQFHNERSPTIRRQRTKSLVITFVVLLCLPGLILLTTDKPILGMALDIWPLILGPILFVILVSQSFKWGTRKLIKDMVIEGQNSQFYSNCSISFDDTGISESSSSGNTIRNWSAVQRIVVSNDHIFVYTSSLEAFIVPKRAFDTDDRFNAFLQSIVDQTGVTVERA
ncbi:YcxB family protein [Gimesia aquarii]|uniref:YcxB-like C-terminal domain-containing protein n=1 Tax=Gimesia aquarii TaxID=2527964 RepID=A0A517WY46_9PLAN|nr:YcxB family protein [Gimesia aquarii]QDU10180.1 hypothetical protein V202x_35790 [Gimesia aquarii]